MNPSLEDNPNAFDPWVQAQVDKLWDSHPGRPEKSSPLSVKKRLHAGCKPAEAICLKRSMELPRIPPRRHIDRKLSGRDNRDPECGKRVPSE